MFVLLLCCWMTSWVCWMGCLFSLFLFYLNFGRKICGQILLFWFKFTVVVVYVVVVVVVIIIVLVVDSGR